MTGIQQRTACFPSPNRTDRRRGCRYQLRLNCRLYQVSKRNVGFGGTVVNMSRSGILMAIHAAKFSELPKPDESVRVLVDLPRHHLFTPRCLECTARVVRVVALETQTQVAVEIGRIQVTDQSGRECSGEDWLATPLKGPIQ